jgi:3-oxoacyl-[acyl-carrier-protein] synthase III
MTFAHIIGTGSALPDRILTNQDLEIFLDTSDEWITRRTGIKERRISSASDQETTTALAARAARAAMQMAGISADQLDIIIIATVTADRPVPSAACLVQKELGADNAAAYDLSAGCSGFIYALELANNHIKAQSSETVLVIGAERLSSILNWEDRGTCVLLGDGAGAVILRRNSAENGLLSTHIKSDGRLWDLLYSETGNPAVPELLSGLDVKPFYLKMAGNRLFKQAVSSMANIAEKALSINHLKREDINLVIPHQANMRIVQAVAEKLRIPMEKVFTNLEKYGNTSAATIPIALDEAFRSGRIMKGDHILMVSFGAGLTWGAAIVRWTF